jgi:hypothetical protein
MEKFCENHPILLGFIVAPVLYATLWLLMAVF